MFYHWCFVFIYLKEHTPELSDQQADSDLFQEQLMRMLTSSFNKRTPM